MYLRAQLFGRRLVPGGQKHRTGDAPIREPGRRAQGLLGRLRTVVVCGGRGRRRGARWRTSTGVEDSARRASLVVPRRRRLLCVLVLPSATRSASSAARSCPTTSVSAGRSSVVLNPKSDGAKRVRRASAGRASIMWRERGSCVKGGDNEAEIGRRRSDQSASVISGSSAGGRERPVAAGRRRPHGGDEPPVVSRHGAHRTPPPGACRDRSTADRPRRPAPRACRGRRWGLPPRRPPRAGAGFPRGCTRGRRRRDRQ